MRSTKYKAIVVKCQPLRETDELITLYTESQGKLRAVAKGIKRMQSKMRSMLQPSNLVEVELSGKSTLPVISSVKALTDFTHLKAGEHSIYTFFAGAELLLRSTPDSMRSPELFVATLKFLEELDTSKPHVVALIHYKLAIIYELGFASSYADLEALTTMPIADLEIVDKALTQEISFYLERSLPAQSFV